MSHPELSLTRRWLLPLLLAGTLAACGKRGKLRLPRPGEGDEPAESDAEGSE